MSSPLLASLLATQSVPLSLAARQPVPLAPMPAVAAAAYTHRFEMIISALLERWSVDLGLVQFWTLPNCQDWSSLSKQQLSHMVAQTHESPSAVNDASLEAFRLKCCEHGIRGEAMGMLGKAWSTGALVMVQVADTLPRAFHPRTKLEGSERVGELVYIPVYDLMFPNKGVRAVMEVMMLQRAAEPMAEVISYISTALNLLQLSLKQPQSEGQHPYGSSRLPNPALMQPYYVSGQQQYAACPAAHAAMAASLFAVCPAAIGPSFQQPPLCVPAGRAARPSPMASRVASPTSVLGGESLLLDDTMKPAQMVQSMSRTVSMRNISLPEAWEHGMPMMLPTQMC